MVHRPHQPAAGHFILQEINALPGALRGGAVLRQHEQPGDRLHAEARRVAQTKRTANYDIKVTDSSGRLIAVCQALAYRTGKPIPFL